MNTTKSRRNFIKKAGIGAVVVAGAGTAVVAGYKSGKTKPPSDKLNMAYVGLGGRAKQNILATKDLGINVVALCDVYWGQRTSEAVTTFPGAARYTDFRKMFEKQKDIDAVLISTADHSHAVIAQMAMKLGKHVYCEKPLAHSIHEVRTMTETAREYGVMTQMGNQGHSYEEARRLVEWIADGAIGQVHEVRAWCDRPWPTNYFPAGITRPEDKPKLPNDLDWDLWIGPAPYRPYHPLYYPSKWRGWIDFGCGAIGDMGCHILDPAFWALKLGSPVSVEASTTNMTEEVNAETYPLASVIRWEFPERKGMVPVKMSWYDGGMLPELPEGISRWDELDTCGAMLIGEKGTIVHGMHGAIGIRLLPEEKRLNYKEPPKTIPRVSGHHSDWIEACKSGKPSSSNFDHSGPLTEMVLTGAIAGRIKNRKLLWDSKNLKFTNCPEADPMIKPDFRKGWNL